MKIIAATRDDAALIGDVVVAAIGEELASQFADGRNIDEVRHLFATLAARDDAQYSYRNSLKAIDDAGNPMGFIVAYDGANLHQLREAFFEEVHRILGRKMEGEMSDECQPDEFYLDSLAVFPHYRGQGVARALITAMAERAQQAGKPLGLLCDKTNHRARSLYESIGFRKVGETKFAWELMDHYQI